MYFIISILVFIQMFNLSQSVRFTNISPLLKQKTMSNLKSKSSTPAGWDIDMLESKMRKGVRKQLRVEQVNEQAIVFFTIQKEILRKKVLVIAALSLALFYLLNIETANIFTFFILLASQFICTTIMPFSDNYLISNICKVQPIIYSSIFYTLFKGIVGIRNREINWSIILVSVIATVARYTLQLYNSFFLISSRNIQAKAIQQKSIFGSLRNFVNYQVCRIKWIVGMSKQLIIILGVSLTSLIILLTYLNRFTIDILQLNHIVIAIVLFTLLEAYLDVIDYLNLALGQSNKLKNIIKDQMPVFITLLRLENKGSNPIIQLDCLKYIFIKNSQIENFLSTQTCKSLVYNTYMDIFNQYSLGELTRTNKIISELFNTIRSNDKQISQHANLFMDLFVYFKKIVAYVSSEWAVLKIVSTLSSLNFLFLILKNLDLDKQQQRQTLVKIMDLCKKIMNRVKDCSRSVSLSNLTCIQLQRVFKIVSDCEQ